VDAVEHTAIVEFVREAAVFHALLGVAQIGSVLGAR